MIFTYLEITDFMKIKHARFDLSPSEMVVLQGGNGQGKSAVFEAMALILAGHRKSSSVKHYIRRGQKQFNLKATIQKSPTSMPYRIDITCSHKTMPPTSKVVRYGDSEYQNSEYDTFMRSQFDIDLISNITLTMQGDNSIAQFKPSQLRDLLKTVFKISFEKEQENVHGMAGHYRESSRSISERVKTSIELLDVLKRDEPILYRPPSQEKLTEKRLEIAAVKDEVQELENELSGLDRLRENIANTDVRIREKHMLIKSYETTHKGLWDKVNALRDRLGTLEENIKSNNSKMDTLKEKQEIRALMEEASREIKELTLEGHELDLQLELAKEGVCPTCKREVPEEWKADKESQESHRIDLHRRLNTLEGSRGDLIEQWQQRMSLEAALDKNEDALKTLKLSLNDAQSQLTDHENSEYVQQAAEDLAELQQLHKSQTDKLETLVKRHGGSISRVESLKGQFKKLEDELQHLEMAKRDYESKLEILEDNNKRKAHIEEGLETLRKDEIAVNHKLEIYEVAEKLVDKYLPAFGVLAAGEEVVRGMLGIINPVLPAWDIRLAPSRDGVFFEYRESEEGEYSPISMASGFETALCNVAFKLTLTAYYGLPLMILDEIDQAAEDVNSYKVFDSISQFRRAYQIHQIWLVSHKKEVVTQLIQEYGQDTQVFHVEDGEFTHSWKGGDMK